MIPAPVPAQPHRHAIGETPAITSMTDDFPSNSSPRPLTLHDVCRYNMEAMALKAAPSRRDTVISLPPSNVDPAFVRARLVAVLQDALDLVRTMDHEEEEESRQGDPM